jgi:hypothetical protein
MLWVNWIQLVQPHLDVAQQLLQPGLGVVEAAPLRSGTSCIWKQIFKPGYHILGSRVETRRFQSLSQLVHSLPPPGEALDGGVGGGEEGIRLVARVEGGAHDGQVAHRFLWARGLGTLGFLLHYTPFSLVVNF